MEYRTSAAIALTALLLAAAPAPSGVRTLEFGDGGRLHGQIDRPGAPGPFPLVFLLPAGAKLDRHGTSPQLPAMEGIYDPIAALALERGWALFRWDRQSAGRSTPTSGERPEDALEALRTALELPGVDRSRIVIIAHGYGTVQLREETDRFLEVVGYSALKGTVLMSSEMTPRAAARLPGNLLVIVGESDGDDRSLTEGVELFHRRSFPERHVETLIVPGANHALCDTTARDWTGCEGMAGTCRIDARVYEAIGRFLERVEASGR